MAKEAFVDLTQDSDEEDAAEMDKQSTAAQTQTAAKSQTDTRREGCSTTSKAPEAVEPEGPRWRAREPIAMLGASLGTSDAIKKALKQTSNARPTRGRASLGEAAEGLGLSADSLRARHAAKVAKISYACCHPFDSDDRQHGTCTDEIRGGALRHESPPTLPPTEERARHFAFTLDPFQEAAIACLHKKESVLVSAHTSAGKTVVAQYAMAMAMKANQRVIYTTPIKALSNQKFRDLGEAFEDSAASIGLMTGDVTVNPDATCLVMTTEILRSMLYRGAAEMREVSWVVFDEVHYLRDKERGVVWEESIVLLPPSIKLVFLSATIPNALQFAQWVAELKTAPCHVVSTDYRPTPLQHYMFPSGGQGLYLVLDEDGQFLEENYSRMITAMDESKRLGRRANKGPPDIQRVVKCIVDQQLEPAIVFAFSRKECEALALQLMRSGKFQLTTIEEQKAIKDVYEQALTCLSSEDQELAQIKMILPLLLQGLGVHHSGLLPILRELIEILFQEGLLRVLFATETFALGLNMPARTCVFTNCRKFDGQENRWITCSEYIQMAGRAGRRGIDDKGFVITMFDEHLDPLIARQIVSGRSDCLTSTFHLTYNMLLNSTRNSGGDTSLTPESVILRSFHHFQNEAVREQSALRQRIGEVKRSLLALEHAPQASNKSTDDDEEEEMAAELFFELIRLREDLEGDVVELMQTPQVCLKYLAPGRLVRAVEDLAGTVEDLAGTAKTAGDVLESKRYEGRSRGIAGRLKGGSSGVGVNGNGDQGTVDWGWGVVLGWERVSKMKQGKREDNETAEGEEGEVVGVAEVEEAHLLDVSSPDAFVVYVLLPTKNKPVKGAEGGVERGVGGVGMVGLKRKATSSDLGVAFEEEDALADLESFDWSSRGERGHAQEDSGGDGGQVNEVNGKECAEWRPVILPMLLSCIRSISSVKVHLPGERGCGGESLAAIVDLRSSTAQRTILVAAMKAFALFQNKDMGAGCEGKRERETDGGGERDGWGEKEGARGSATPSRSAGVKDWQRPLPKLDLTYADVEWQRALPMLDLTADPAVLDVLDRKLGDGQRAIRTMYAQLSEVDLRIRASSWHAPYVQLLKEERLWRAGGVCEGALAGGHGHGASQSAECGASRKVDVLRKCRERSELRRELEVLSSRVRRMRSQHSFSHELKGRMRVLRRLGYLTDDDVVTLKGRAACEVEILQDLVVVEMMLQGAFHDLSPPDVAAVCSCLVTEEKDDTAQVQLHEVKAREVVSKMRECSQRVRAAKMEAGLAIREEEESAYNTSLMDAVHMWCSGASFADVCARSKMFEGSIIRTFRREAELLRQLQAAAQAIGDEKLEHMFKETLKALQRGLPFSASLYL